MALNLATIHQVNLAGSDGNAGVDTNGGGFNPANASFDATLTTTTNTGNTTTPEISTANYTFVAGDVNHWVFLTGGSGWTLPSMTYNGQTITVTGLWAKITSVAAGKATLNAAVGAMVVFTTGGPIGANTVAGIATVGTPTSGKWSVDYSQCGTCPYAFTDLASAGAGSTFTSAAKPVGPNMVGNLINITGGTNFTTGLFEVISTSGTTATTDRACTTGAGASGTANLGGCLLTTGQAGKNHVGGNHIYVKFNASAYSQTSNTSNTAAGKCTLAAGVATGHTQIIGYNALMGDNPTGSGRPTIQQQAATAGMTTISVGQAADAECIIVDGNNNTSSIGIGGSSNAQSIAYYCSVKNCRGGGFSTIQCYFCDATGCTTTAAFAACAASFCVAWSNTVTGFSGSAVNAEHFFHQCISVNNTGATSDGFSDADSGTHNMIGCTAYGNGRDGFRFYVTTGAIGTAVNCISYGNGVSATGKGYGTAGSNVDNPVFWNCAAGGNSGVNWDTQYNQLNQHSNITLTADPFTNKSGSDFSLNNNSGGGALLRALGIPNSFPGLATTADYTDVGAAQHQDAGGSSGVAGLVGIGGGLIG
jgi:hypothetical protein